MAGGHGNISDMAGQQNMVARATNWSLWICLAVLLFGAGAVATVQRLTSAELESTYGELKLKIDGETERHATQTEQALRQVYQNIRTLSLLPDVRAMDRHATNVGETAHETIQQIYNNLWSNVSVSEIYFVPENFDQAKVDPVTGEPEAPALMYDEMITGDESAASTGATPENPEQPELEGEEYVLIARQIAYLKEHFPARKSIKGLDVPMVSGAAVITCDNTDFNTTLDDYDRKGVVFTVPTYRKDGSFAGVVSAIVRLRVLEKYLPERDAALVHVASGLNILSAEPGQAKASQRFVSKAEIDPSLRSSSVTTLDLPDPQGKWVFWHGISNAAFEDSPEIAAIQSQQRVSYAVIGLIVVLGIGLVLFFDRRYLKPARAVTSALIDISNGNVEIDVPLARRADILGDISRAVITFRDKVLALRSAEVERGELERQQMALQAAQEEDAQRRAAEVLVVVEKLGSGLQRLADCNIRMTIDEPFAADYENIRHDFNRSISEFQKTLEDVLARTAEVYGNSEEMLKSSVDLAQRSEQQAVALEQASAALEQISVNVSTSKTSALETRTLVTEARNCSTRSSTVVDDARSAMERIEKSTSEIGQIIGVIDNIAFQTNLLALNAGVEAARAGDAGKGFAVVAHEVRELAQRSALAAKEIKELVSNSSLHVQTGVRLVGETGDALLQMDGFVASIDVNIERIATGVVEQSSALAEITTGLNQIDAMTQQNTAISQSVATLGTRIADQASGLSRLVERFQLNRRLKIRQPGEPLWSDGARNGANRNGNPQQGKSRWVA